MPGTTQKAVHRQIAVDWTIKPANGSAKKASLSKFIDFLEDKGYDTEKLEDKVSSELRKHVKKSGFTVTGVDPTLEFVDVKFKEEPKNPPNHEFTVGLKSVKAGEGQAAMPAAKFTLMAKFDLISHGGRRTRRRHR
jgi:hypothetical protein